jgi:hypothetical protein
MRGYRVHARHKPNPWRHHIWNSVRCRTTALVDRRGLRLQIRCLAADQQKAQTAMAHKTMTKPKSQAKMDNVESSQCDSAGDDHALGHHVLAEVTSPGPRQAMYVRDAR